MIYYQCKALVYVFANSYIHSEMNAAHAYHNPVRQINIRRNSQEITDESPSVTLPRPYNVS